MKKVKRILSLFVLIATLLTLFACKKAAPKENEPVGASATVVIAGEVVTEYTVDLSKVNITKGFVSVLEYLEELGALDFEMGDSGMIESVGELENDATRGEWIYIYTTAEEDVDVSAYAQTVEYEGVTITSSGVGASDMKVTDGVIIYVGTIIYE